MPRIYRSQSRSPGTRWEHIFWKHRRPCRRKRCRFCRTTGLRVSLREPVHHETEPMFQPSAPTRARANLPEENFAVRVRATAQYQQLQSRQQSRCDSSSRYFAKSLNVVRALSPRRSRAKAGRAYDSDVIISHAHVDCNLRVTLCKRALESPAVSFAADVACGKLE